MTAFGGAKRTLRGADKINRDDTHGGEAHSPCPECGTTAMGYRPTTIERAFMLAASGRFQTVPEVKQALHAEGCTPGDPELASIIVGF